MINLNIYCTTIKYYKVMEKLPAYVKPLGLGNLEYPNNWLDEKIGKNISSLNKFYAEFTGFYWIWKNQIKLFKKNDLIGNCHNRVLWLDNLYSDNKKFTFSSLYSNFLSIKNPKLTDSEVIQVQPITYFKKNKNLFSDFEISHKTSALKDCMSFLSHDTKKEFFTHMSGQLLFPHNMFITKVKHFEEYCEVVFPWLEKCMNYCHEKKICNDYNMRMPAFLAERFTSFWFNRFKKKSLLSYARLGKFHLSNSINSFINTTKIPFSFSQYPTTHRY